MRCDQTQVAFTLLSAPDYDAPPQPSSINERRLWIFLAVWFAVGILQSAFTNLNGEEAYYATFAQHLAWGYFDHPPALALFIRLGMLLFHNDLGPRFMMVVLSTATIWIGSRLLEPKHIPVYIATVSGLALTQAGSFLIKTDVPLLFFEAIFFYFYREYLRQETRVSIAVLPIAIAGMFLSKYHGLLVVALTVVANPILLRRASFWLILCLTMVLVLPHAIWLYSNDFVTVRYHLGGRTDGGFSWINIVTYIFMEPLVFGPAVGILLLPAAFVTKTRDPFDRALKFNLIGVLVFFLAASLAVRIHMHWTSIALIPLLALAIPYIYDRIKLRRLLVTLAVGTAIAFLPVRLYLAWDFLPQFIDRKMEVTHGWDKWAEDIRTLAKGRSVIFVNDYGSTGKYSYYTGQLADSYNAFWYQGTQQELWPIEENFRGKPAIIVNGEFLGKYQTARTRNGVQITYRLVDDFQGYTKVEIRPSSDLAIHCVSNAPFELPITLINRYKSPITFEKNTDLAPTLMYCFFKGQQIISAGSCDVLAGISIQHQADRKITLKPPTDPGVYTLRFAIHPGWLPPTNNSGSYTVTVGPAARSAYIAGVPVN